jgi:hypothetical protein
MCCGHCRIRKSAQIGYRGRRGHFRAGWAGEPLKDATVVGGVVGCNNSEIVTQVLFNKGPNFWAKIKLFILYFMHTCISSYWYSMILCVLFLFEHWLDKSK